MLLQTQQPAAADETKEWDGIPPEWSGQIDYIAFCMAGDWSFLPHGEEVGQCSGEPCAPQEISVDRVFFKMREGKYGARWPSRGPHVDELTVLKIARDEAGEIRIQAFAGDTLAAWQTFPTSRPGGLFQQERPTECEPGRAWRFLGAAGDTDQEYVSLALGENGSLLVRRKGEERYMWPLPPIPMGKREWQFFARFPPAPVRQQSSPRAN